LNNQSIIFGGQFSEKLQKIVPTLINQVSLDDDIMRGEIFGPILPIISYHMIDEAIEIVRKNEKPLALYFFCEDKRTEHMVLKTLSYGGGCINDTNLHSAHLNLPFGGVGQSGTGAYHGRASFDTFTHKKSIFKKSKYFDLNLRYAPLDDSKLKWIRKIFK